MVKLFLDSADVGEIVACKDRGIIHGVTTNPTILAKAGAKHLGELFRAADGLPVSVDWSNLDRSHMEDWPTNLVVKVPIGWIELLVNTGGGFKTRPVNITACMTFHQALLAAQMGAAYVSLFWGRIRDGGANPALVMIQASLALKGSSTQIIAGSIRSLDDILDAAGSGADIVTVPYKFFEPMTRHPETDKVVAQFRKDAQR